MSDNVALVVGARGVIGGNLVRHLQELNGWQVIGLSRRGGESAGTVRHLPVDLLDAADARRTLAGLKDVTHVFYAAYQDRPSFAELVEPNQRMLVNVLRAIEPAAQRCRVLGACLERQRTTQLELTRLRIGVDCGRGVSIRLAGPLAGGVAFGATGAGGTRSSGFVGALPRTLTHLGSGD